LLGKQWIEADFFLKILAVSSFFYMQEMFNRVLFKVYNRTDVILKLEFIKKGIQAFSVFLGLLYMNIHVLMYGFLISSILSYFINYYVSRKMFNHLSAVEMINLFKSIFIGALIAAIFVFLKDWFNYEGEAILFTIPLVVTLYTIVLSNWNLFKWKDGINLLNFIKK
jgi:O-antigen/teichoic acid export membrane protein